MRCARIFRFLRWHPSSFQQRRQPVLWRHARRAQGKGQARDFSTANPTSAYDTKSFGKATVINKDILPSVVSGLTPDVAAKKRKLARAKNADELRGAQLPGFSTGNAWNAATPEQLINEDSKFK
jgi:hypothetical protein